MKIIAKVNRETFLAEVTLDELSKWANRWEYQRRFEDLRIGEEFDLGKGFDFRNEIVAAHASTRDLIQRNSAVLESILRGVSIGIEVNAEKAKKKEDGQ